MIVLLNQQNQHLELNRMYFFQILTVTMIIIKRDFEHQNYQRYHKDNSSKYQKKSSGFRKGAISKVVKEDNVDKRGRKIDSKNYSGNTSQCAICQSIYHWANKCPDRDNDDSNKVNVTLFSQEIFEYYNAKFVV